MTVRVKTWQRQRLGRAAAWLLTAALVLMTPGSGLVLAAPAASATGVSASLTVASDPVGAAVFVDGRARGTTPLALDQITAGEHRVQVSLDGYLENSRVVVVEPGESGSLRVNLTPSGTRVARLQVEPEPEPVAPPREEPIIEKKGGNGKKIALIGLGVAAVGAGVFLLLPKNSPPTVTGVTASPGSGVVGIASGTDYQFTAQASDPDSGDTLTYEWNFGDGQSSTQSSPTHTYAQAGNFSVTLTVKDKKGESASGGTQVTVVSYSGTWRGTFDNVANSITFTWNLSQSGANISGSYSDPVNGSGSVSGQVRQGRDVTLTGRVPGFVPFVFGGTLSNDGNQITGTATGFGGAQPRFTLNRQ